MINKFKNFWRILFSSIKVAYNKAFREPVQITSQKWRDIKNINFLAIFVDKISNLALSEATFEVQKDSDIAEPLTDLLRSIEDHKYDIASNMLADGDYYIFPSTDEKGKIYNSYLTQEQVRILNMDADIITEANAIIDWWQNSQDNRYYFLLRKHKLNGNGNLDITYSVIDESGKPAVVPQWEYLKNEAVTYQNANHIGFARFKSPVTSRGLSPVYGVPLNFGCAEIEARIDKDMKEISDEFKNAASKIFTDPRNLIKDEKTGEYNFLDNIFAVQQRAGQSGANIDVYAPSIRYAEYREKLFDDLLQYEQQIGVDRGFLTPFENGSGVTATEIRRANASTISMVEKIREALSKGIEETMKVDSIFLNISEDLYSVKIDWYDVFENADTQWQRLIDAYGIGAVETEDIIKWLFPNMSENDIADKIDRINNKKSVNTDDAINRILRGE